MNVFPLPSRPQGSPCPAPCPWDHGIWSRLIAENTEHAPYHTHANCGSRFAAQLSSEPNADVVTGAVYAGRSQGVFLEACSRVSLAPRAGPLARYGYNTEHLAHDAITSRSYAHCDVLERNGTRSAKPCHRRTEDMRSGWVTHCSSPECPEGGTRGPHP